MRPTTYAKASVLLVLSLATASAQPVAINPTGDAHGDIAISGTGNAYGFALAISGTGDATATISSITLIGNAQSSFPISILGTCNGSDCIQAAPGNTYGEWLSISAFGTSRSEGVAISGTGSSQVGSSPGDAFAAASGTGDAHGPYAASGTGDATSSCPMVSSAFYCGAISGTGDANGPIAISAFGHATGFIAISGCDLAGACL